MNAVARIPVTREKLPEVIAKAFELSRPQGLGFLHFEPGPIPPDRLQEMLDRSDNAESAWRKNVGMDYVDGRAVKLTLFYDEEAGTHYLEDNGRWFDHSDAQWAELREFALGGEA